MITHTQIKINLSIQLKEFLESKAKKFGMPTASYIKHLILKDVEEIDYPVFEASEATIIAAKKAMKEYKDGKSIRVEDIDKFFREL